jgi:hypothetical protein
VSVITQSAARVRSEVIRTETVANANTAQRVGSLLTDMTDSLVFAPFVGSGASHAAGYVPDPGAVAGATRYLCETGGWAVPAGSFTNPANPADNGKLAYANAGGLSYASAIKTDGTYLGFGAGTLPTTGDARISHATTFLVGRTNGGADAPLSTWGVTATDQFALGADNVASILLAAVASLSVRLGGAAEWDFTTTQLDAHGNNIVNLGALNGVTVATGVIGTALADSSPTLSVAGGGIYELKVPITANRSVKLSIAGPPRDQQLVSIRKYVSTAGFTYSVTDQSGGLLFTFPDGKCIADFEYSTSQGKFLPVGNADLV